MNELWSGQIRNLMPYVPGEQPQDKKYIKLNTNENPYGPSPQVVKAIQQATGDGLRLYPDPDSGELCRAIADYYKLEPDQVFVSNGSDEALALTFYSFFQQDKPILFPAVSYSFYPVYSRFFGIVPRMVPLDKDFNIRVEDYKSPNGGIIIPNPNAPTSIGLPLAAIEEIVAANPHAVVAIDEAYVDFGAESAVPLIAKYNNLLVIQTMSKSRSLAGMRIGFIMGHRDLVDGLNRAKNSFNSYPLDRLAQAAAVAAIKDEAHFKTNCQKIMVTRDRVIKALRALDFKVQDSLANFLFATHPEKQAEDLFLQLKEQGVLVRYFKQAGISNYLRITIGTDAEMDVFLEKVKELL